MTADNGHSVKSHNYFLTSKADAWQWTMQAACDCGWKGPTRTAESRSFDMTKGACLADIFEHLSERE